MPTYEELSQMSQTLFRCDYNDKSLRADAKIKIMELTIALQQSIALDNIAYWTKENG